MRHYYDSDLLSDVYVTQSEVVKMETWKLALRIIQLVIFIKDVSKFCDLIYMKVLVITVFLLARFGLGFKILQYGYVVGEFPEPSILFKKTIFYF